MEAQFASEWGTQSDEDEVEEINGVQLDDDACDAEELEEEYLDDLFCIICEKSFKTEKA